MDIFVKSCGLILVAVILSIVLSNNNKSFHFVITIAVCCFVGISALDLLRPVIVFFNTLEKQGNWNKDILQVLVKCVGVGILSDITSGVCNDSGNGAMAKSLKLLSSAIILWLSIPLFEGLLDLVNSILGKF